MKRKFSLALLCAVFAIASSDAFAAYLEGGKPVTRRQRTVPAKSPEKVVPAEEKAAVPAEEKASVPAEKVDPVKPEEKVAPAQPAEKILPENAETAKPEPQPVPEKKPEAVETPPQKAISEKPLPQEPSPEQNVPATEQPSNRRSPREPLPEQDVPAAEQPSPVAEDVSEESDSVAKKSRGETRSRAVEEDDYIDEVSRSRADSDERESRHFFGISGFYAFDLSDIEIDLAGASLDYKYRLWDGRCPECGYGNSLLLTAKLGWGIGSDEFSDWYSSGEADVDLLFGTVGFEFRHQISQNVSFALGAFVGAEYYKMNYDIRTYDYYDYYYGEYYNGSRYSGSDSDFSLCYGLTATLGIEFSKHFGLEFGGEFHQSTVNLKDFDDWDEPFYAIVRAGVVFRF